MAYGLCNNYSVQGDFVFHEGTNAGVINYDNGAYSMNVYSDETMTGVTYWETGTYIVNENCTMVMNRVKASSLLSLRKKKGGDDDESCQTQTVNTLPIRRVVFLSNIDAINSVQTGTMKNGVISRREGFRFY